VTEVQETFVHAYDPRVTRLEDRWYVTWCNGYHGPTIGVAWTHDFATFHQLDNASLPFNRNGVLFPRRISDRYAMLSRPSDNGHTPFGDIFYSESPDLVHWGRHRHVMAPIPRTPWCASPSRTWTSCSRASARASVERSPPRASVDGAV
jgi:beta-1,4-mannooligosaccharide/beta-1,4-mannosyl-N-acetylglucosamine phosphorylase